MEMLTELRNEVVAELMRAMQKHGPMNSSHEGYAMILEELDELWEKVRKQTDARSKANMRKEAIQIAAMAMRFVIDVCDKNS